MPPVAAANPSPASPAAAVGTVVPVPMVDLLHFCLCIFVKGRCLWRLKFVEDAASGSWNTRYCVDWADSACKGRCPGNTKHCSQEGSPIHNKPPKVPELKRARCRMSSPAHGEIQDPPAAEAAHGSYQRRKGRTAPIHVMSAKDYPHHQEGDGCCQNRCEQPSRLADTFFHCFSPRLQRQQPSGLSRSAYSQRVRPLRLPIRLWSCARFSQKPV